MNLVRSASWLRLWTLCLAWSFLFPLYAHAQSVMVGDVDVDPQDFLKHQDPQTRKAACLACHGKHAGGDIDFGPDVQFGTPALRGMRYGYLKQSLIDYKTGSRPHKEMSLIASMLDDETIEFMARAFAAYPTPPFKTTDQLAELANKDRRFRKGQAIAQEGLPEKDVPACMTCHGALGEGDPELGPRLAGQNSLYVRQQFTAYADEARQTAQAEIMQPVVAGMSGDEIEAIAYYYEQLIQVDKP